VKHEDTVLFTDINTSASDEYAKIPDDGDGCNKMSNDCGN